MQESQYCLFYHRFCKGYLILPYLKFMTSLNKSLNLLQTWFLKVKPPSSFTAEETEYLTNRIQNGGTEVVEVMFI
jgi:malate/lactate dehydrogenase